MFGVTSLTDRAGIFGRGGWGGFWEGGIS
eukprot:COSAG02_NODE_18844_length_914_cov_4.255215_2_plen_28_part_01